MSTTIKIEKEIKNITTILNEELNKKAYKCINDEFLETFQDLTQKICNKLISYKDVINNSDYLTLKRFIDDGIMGLYDEFVEKLKPSIIYNLTILMIESNGFLKERKSDEK